MELLIVGCGVLFSVFSTIVLSYISIATMVGPWIAPTLVLIGHNVFSFMRTKTPPEQAAKNLAWMQAIGAGGGIIATGVGFALPMLYFLAPDVFASWLTSPWYFMSIIMALCLTAGGLGLIVGRWLKQRLLVEQQLPFPVSKLTVQTITSQNHPQQSRQLMQGILGTLIVCILRDGFWHVKGLIAKTYYILPSLFAQEFAFSIWPSLWAIGFSVGTSIVIPLTVGLLAKYLVIYPLANHSTYLPFSLFSPLPTGTFTIAFCSGLVLYELLLNVPAYASKWWKWMQNRRLKASSSTQGRHAWLGQTKEIPSTGRMIETTMITLGIIALLSYFHFSAAAQGLFILFTVIATYSICLLGGKIGMVPFGRFSTFIVVPLLLMFNFNAVQATITCVFFDICAATATDLLFDYKTAELCNLDEKKMYRYQWLGLIVTAVSLSVILWLLFTHLQLGSEAFFAQRGKAKALLLQSLHFDTYIVLMGVVFGWILRKCKVNTFMVFGGLIMPNSISIGLITGGLCNKLVTNVEHFQPLCAGIVASESLWILVSILISMF